MLPLLPFMQADWWAARGRFQWSISRSRSRRLRGDAVGGRRSATREGLPQDGATHRTSSSANSTHDTSTNDTDRSLDGIYRPYCVASRIRRLPAPLDGRLGGRIACALRYLGDEARPLVNAHGLDRVRELTGRVAKIFMARSRRSIEGGRMKAAHNGIVGLTPEEEIGEGIPVQTRPSDPSRHRPLQAREGSVLIVRLGPPSKRRGKGCDGTVGECQHPVFGALARDRGIGSRGYA